MRELTVNEIAQLEERGCWAEDWSDILVDEAFVPTQMEQVMLYGHVEIGSLSGFVELEEGFRRRCCVRNAVLRNVTIGDGCLVENVRGYISNTQIGDRCYVANIGVITNQDGSSFGCGTEISVLNEGGDGNIVIFEGLTAQLAWLMVNFPKAKTLATSQLSTVNCQLPTPHIGSGSRIVDVKEMNNVKIGEGCEVKGSCKLTNCTVLSTDDAGTLIGSDVIIEDSVVAAGASVIDGASWVNPYMSARASLLRQASSLPTVIWIMVSLVQRSVVLSPQVTTRARSSLAVHSLSTMQVRVPTKATMPTRWDQFTGVRSIVAARLHQVATSFGQPM